MPGRQHHLTNLKKFTRYSVVVQAFNALGPGPMSQEVVASTLEDGKRPWNIASISIRVPASNSCARKINNSVPDESGDSEITAQSGSLIRRFFSTGFIADVEMLISLRSRPFRRTVVNVTRRRPTRVHERVHEHTKRINTPARSIRSPRSPARGRVSGRKSRRLFPHFTIRAGFFKDSWGRIIFAPLSWLYREFCHEYQPPTRAGDK